MTNRQGQLAQDSKGISIIMAVSPETASQNRKLNASNTVSDLLPSSTYLLNLFHGQLEGCNTSVESKSQVFRILDYHNLSFDNFLASYPSTRIRLREKSYKENSLGPGNQRRARQDWTSPPRRHCQSTRTSKSVCSMTRSEQGSVIDKGPFLALPSIHFAPWRRMLSSPTKSTPSDSRMIAS